jgi:uncharacterized protein (TIGR03435 family)
MGNKFDPGMARWTNYPLGELIGEAFDLRNYQTIGRPEWLSVGTWDIDAARDGATTYARKKQMLQALIEERFHLKFHWETKDVSGYSLVIAKLDWAPDEIQALGGEVPSDPNNAGLPRLGFRQGPIESNSLSRGLNLKVRQVIQLAGRVTQVFGGHADGVEQ